MSDIIYSWKGFVIKAKNKKVDGLKTVEQELTPKQIDEIVRRVKCQKK